MTEKDKVQIAVYSAFLLSIFGVYIVYTVIQVRDSRAFNAKLLETKQVVQETLDGEQGTPE